MRRFIATIAATLFATAGFAGQSDRYNDLMLDTSEDGMVYSEGASPSRPNSRPADLRLESFEKGSHPTPNFSTRSMGSNKDFAYGGYGRNNDTR